MNVYPRGALLFLIIISTAAVLCAILIFSGSQPADYSISVIIVWSVLAVLSESFSVYISSGNIYISTIEAVFFGAYLSGGPVASLFCILATALFTVRKQEKGLSYILTTPPRLTIFNVSHFIIILFLVDRLYIYTAAAAGGTSILPALITAPVFFLVSCVFNALFYRLEEGRSFFRYLIDVFKPYYADALPASFAAVIIAITYPEYGVLSVLFFITPIIVARLAFGGRGS